MTAALVIGKFYPPHQGHLHLLRAAMAARPQVVVLCLGSSGDTYSPQQRLAALLENAASVGLDTARILGRAGCDETPFDTADPTAWASHVEVFRAFLVGMPRVDTVVTSETYGPELAHRLGLTHTECDPSRTVVVGAATDIRADPVGAWPALGPGTRRMLTTRVVLLGAESTGTSTIATGLADRLRARGGPWARTQLVAEYGRELTERKQRAAADHSGFQPLSVQWDVEDFAEVVREQTAAEERAATIGGPALVCDTDAFATPVWERRYLPHGRARLDPEAWGRGDVYLLTHHEGVPFVQDGTRDGEHLRAQMTQGFAEALVTHSRPFAVLTGNVQQRLDLAERIADQTMRRKLTFEEPI